MVVRDRTILKEDHVDGGELRCGGGRPSVVPSDTTQKAAKVENTDSQTK